MERRGGIRVTTPRGGCAACGLPHTFDIAYRCFGCDEEVCAICVVLVLATREPWCPECAPEVAAPEVG